MSGNFIHSQPAGSGNFRPAPSVIVETINTTMLIKKINTFEYTWGYSLKDHAGEMDNNLTVPSEQHLIRISSDGKAGDEEPTIIELDVSGELASEWGYKYSDPHSCELTIDELPPISSDNAIVYLSEGVRWATYKWVDESAGGLPLYIKEHDAQRVKVKISFTPWPDSKK